MRVKRVLAVNHSDFHTNTISGIVLICYDRFSPAVLMFYKQSYLIFLFYEYSFFWHY